MAVEMASKLIAEFVGTFLLVFTVGCNVLSGNAVWGGVSIACVLMVSIYSLGKISGGNFNPAVSVALGLSKTMGGPGSDWADVAKYCAVQVLAGLCGSGAYFTLFWDNFNLAPAPGFSWVQAGLCELLYTFMLCFVVLNVAAAGAHSPAVDNNQYYALAIGFVIVAGAYGAGAVSGGCFNPAVAIGIDASSATTGFGWCIAYTAFELAGAALAAGLFKLVRPAEFGGEASASTKLLSEFLGTYMLVLTVGLNVLGKSPSAAYSIAASLMCMIYALGDVSGAHFNPAVTLAIFLSKRCDLTPADVGTYMGAQVAGGIAASLTYCFIYHGASFPLGHGKGFGWIEVAIAEFLFTFVLAFVVLAVAVSPTTKNGVTFGLAIGSCVTVGGFAIGGISGGSLNPAVSIGVGVPQLFSGINKAIIYSVFELAGGAAAAALFSVTHAVDVAHDPEAKAVSA